MAEFKLIGESEGFSEEEFKDVILCLTTLLSVRAGSQPLDREFGIEYDGIVGYPDPIAQNTLSVEIMDKVSRYEPRAEVDSVKFTKGVDGQLIPHIHFVKNDSYEAEDADEEDEDEDD